MVDVPLVLAGDGAVENDAHLHLVSLRLESPTRRVAPQLLQLLVVVLRTLCGIGGGARIIIPDRVDHLCRYLLHCHRAPRVKAATAGGINR